MSAPVTTHQYNRSGFIVLVSVLIVSAVGVVIAVTLLTLGTGYVRSWGAMDEGTRANTLAMACADTALQEIKNNAGFSGAGGLTLGADTCTYLVTDLGGVDRQIDVEGMDGSAIRRVQIIIDAVAPDINIVSWEEVVNF